MAIDSTHPLYREKEDDWRVMRDTFAGERIIKEAGTLYLPPTPGQILDGALTGFNSVGYGAYQAYKQRAVFFDLVQEAVDTQVGVMHREPPVIELPAELEPMRNNATRKRGETLPMLLRRINEQQLLFGRHGLLLDVAAGALAPHFVTYNAASIINWDDERILEFEQDLLHFLVVNETSFIRGKAGVDVFEWTTERRFRVAFLDELTGVYTTYTETDDIRSEEIVPTFNGRPLPFIPFTFIGANDLCSEPDEIPLLGLAEIALALYRGEADYRQTLFMQGQDTLVVIGEEEPDDDALDNSEKATRVGAGAKINVPLGGDAKFEGVNSEGLGEQRRAQDDLHTRGQQAGSRLLEPRGSQAESGEALKVRVAASTSSLHQVALTGAAGLEEALKKAAIWVGANPDEVRVVPNLDFTETDADPADLDELMDARAKGAPISLRSIHGWMRDNDLTKKTFEDEVIELMAEEEMRSRLIDSRTAEPEPEGDESGEADLDE